MRMSLLIPRLMLYIIKVVERVQSIVNSCAYFVQDLSWSIGCFGLRNQSNAMYIGSTESVRPQMTDSP